MLLFDMFIFVNLKFVVMYENLVLNYNAVSSLKSFNELVLIRDVKSNFAKGKIFNVCEKISFSGRFVFSGFECIVDDVIELGDLEKTKALKIVLSCV